MPATSAKTIMTTASTRKRVTKNINNYKFQRGYFYDDMICDEWMCSEKAFGLAGVGLNVLRQSCFFFKVAW